MSEKINLEKFIPYRLARIATLISRDLQETYSKHSHLTVPEWRVLVTLGDFEKMTAKEIGRHSSMHKTKVSRAVRALEDRRWLVRAENEIDRREEYLSLSAKGKEIYHDLVPFALNFQKKILNTLGKDAERFQELLTRIEKHYEK